MNRSTVGMLLGLALSFAAQAAEQNLLNVSYDPTRELYQAINTAFAADWKAKSGDTVHSRSKHSGSTV